MPRPARGLIGGALIRFVVGAVAVVAAVAIYATNYSHLTAGTIPLMHLAHDWGWTYDDVPDLAGATSVVTGASSGLGLAVAQGLAEAGAAVVATARSEAKCAATIAAIEARARTCRAKPRCVVMELLSLRSVARAAEELGALDVDHLVLNAGIMTPPFALSDDGLESQFQTNHLGHFYLLNALLPALRRAADARAAPSTVVAVSSIAHHFAPPDELWTAEALNDAAGYDRLAWYGWSKLCNVLTARELNRRERAAAAAGAAPKLIAHAVHPGGVRGKLLRFSKLPQRFIDAFEGAFYWSATDAALTVLRPLLDPAFKAPETAGTYFAPIARPWPASAAAASAETAAKLWAASDVLVADALGNWSAGAA